MHLPISKLRILKKFTSNYVTIPNPESPYPSPDITTATMAEIDLPNPKTSALTTPRSITAYT